MKKCPKCDKACGARQKKCSCGQQFPFKSKREKKLKGEDVDWKILSKGMRIRVLKGSGPYKLINGVKHYIGADAGIYTVDKIDAKGIRVYDNNGFNYLYMGDNKPSITGGILCAYKIRKLTTTV